VDLERYEEGRERRKRKRNGRRGYLYFPVKDRKELGDDF
jgi:hypothetical protein